MKKTMKWTIMLAAAMMLIALAGSAMADDRVYTSPSFCIPGSRIEIPVNEQTAEETETEPETTADETVPAEAVNETETVLPPVPQSLPVPQLPILQLPFVPQRFLPFPRFLRLFLIPQ